MVIIENGTRRIVVDDGHGALVVSIHDGDVDLLAEGNPTDPALRQQGDLGATGYRGWIDCFPTISPETDDTNGRSDLALAGHGELWWRPWKIDDSGVSEVGLSCRLDALSVAYTRRVALGPDSLVVTSTITNLADDAINFIWASHPLFAADEATWIELDDAEVTRWPEEGGPERLDSVWPGAGRRRHWSGLPTGTATKFFLPWPADGVSFSSGGRERHIDFEVQGEQQAPYLGVWANRGGFPAGSPLEHFAIEPTIGSTDSLAVSYERGSAGRLAAGSTVSFAVTVSF